MLGRYVLPEFVAYYQAAFSLISSAIGLLAFSAVLFPIFSRLKGSRLNLGLKKSVYVTLPLSILAIVATWILAPSIFQFVNFITGRDYSNSVLLLRILAIALVTDPLI
jgi:O-antigen/teichoic acid export membrane protein